MKRIYLSLFCLLFVAGFYGAANALTIPATVGVSPATGVLPDSGQGVAMVEGNRKAVFYFNVNVLSSGTALNSATLRLLLPEMPNGNTSLSVYKISGVWPQLASSFAPVIDGVPVASFHGAEIPISRAIEIDVTSVVRDWANAPTGMEGFLVAGKFGEGGGATVPLNFDGATTFGLTASLEVNPQDAPANVTVDPYEQWPGMLKSRLVSPVITVQPWVTSAGSLSVSAHGAGALGYQWYRDGVALAGATGPQLATNGLQGGNYVVRVQNGYGEVNSGVVKVGKVGGEGRKVFHSGSMKTVSSSWGANFAIKEDGTLWSWGDNSMGQLGLGNEGGVVVAPVQIGFDSNWSYVKTHGLRTYGMKSDGTLWAWGDNMDHGLGTGEGTTRVLVPTQVGDLGDWSAVVVGYAFSANFGIKKDGSLWAWGGNVHGDSGTQDGEVVVSTPIKVSPATDWAMVVKSYDGSVFGLREDGTLWAWGKNTDGRLGVGGSGAFVGTPVKVGDATDWVTVVTSNESGSTFGLRKGGTLWAWGNNANGRLGTGMSDPYLTMPTRVGTATDWSAVYVANESTFGLKTDGTLWAWGKNYYGELGIGTLDQNIMTPTQIGHDSDWSTVFASYYLTFGLKTDGTLWSWGSNFYGSLGVGPSEPQVATPMQVGSDKDWAFVSVSSAGQYPSVYGHKSTKSLWAWGGNKSYGSFGTLGLSSTESGIFYPTKIESAVPWKLPSSFQIDTNSPTPAGAPVPRIGTGSPLALRINAPASDSVAAVEWYIDGTRIRTVRTAPWAATVQAPALAAEAQSRRLVVEARVLNASGQLIDTARQEMDVVRDPIPPVVVGQPSVLFGPSGASVRLSFSKTLDAAPVAGAFKVLSAGTDGLLGSQDDFVVPIGTVMINESTATIYFPNALGAGSYRLVVDGRLMDSVGNPLGSEYATDFVNATSVWVGGQLGYWADPANWSGGVVPFNGADVIFPNTWGNRSVVVAGQNPVSVRSIRVHGETALVGINLSVAQNVSLWADLIFSGTNNLQAGGIVENLYSTGVVGESPRHSRIKVKAGVWTDALVPGQTSTRSGLLRFGSGLKLVDDFEVETAGMDGSTQLEVDTLLNLGGKTLRVLGGYAGSLKFGAGVSPITGQSGFEITGPGKIALDWEESVLANPATQFNRLSLNVSAPAFVLPAGVELSVARRGKVTVGSPGFTNSGILRVANGGYLKALNYTKVGVNAAELVIGNGVLEKATADRNASQMKSSAFVNGSNLVIKADGTLWAWGVNTEGQLGLGFKVEPVSTPTQVGTDTNWAFVATDGWSVYGLKTDGTLFAWGSNYNGWLGLGLNDSNVMTPTQVGNDSDWATVVTMGATFAIKKNGTLWAWGSNQRGELGVGSSLTDVTHPTQVGVSSDWGNVATCFILGQSTYGLKTDGSLWAWGYNVDGGLGLGTSSSVVMAPTQVGSSKDWASVTTLGSTFALKTDGTLWAWGQGEGLGLGVGSSTVMTPTQVGGDQDWFSVVTSGPTFAIKTDGTLWAWGYNGGGILGLGSNDMMVPVPTQVGSEGNWANISIGVSVYGLKLDGTLWAWGSNVGGRLGVQSPSFNLSTPSQVGADSDWSNVVSPIDWMNSQVRAFGFKSDGTLWGWGDNANGSIGTGSMQNPLTTPTKIESVVPWK